MSWVVGGGIQRGGKVTLAQVISSLDVRSVDTRASSTAAAKHLQVLTCCVCVKSLKKHFQ